MRELCIVYRVLCIRRLASWLNELGVSNPGAAQWLYDRPNVQTLTSVRVAMATRRTAAVAVPESEPDALPEDKNGAMTAAEPDEEGAEKQPPPERASEVQRRRAVLISFWLVVLLLGLPIWWKTTSIYRASLPVDEMLEWADGRVSGRPGVLVFVLLCVGWQASKQASKHDTDLSSSVCVRHVGPSSHSASRSRRRLCRTPRRTIFCD